MVSPDGKYKPHRFLKKAISAMKPYRLPDGKVDIAAPETGAIIAIILYLIANEPKVCRTKLECYIIMMNKLVLLRTDIELFTWRLNSKGRIANFNAIYEHMIACGLLLKNGSARFLLLPETANIIPRLPIILGNKLRMYFDVLIRHSYGCTAAEMLRYI